MLWEVGSVGHWVRALLPVPSLSPSLMRCEHAIPCTQKLTGSPASMPSPPGWAVYIPSSCKPKSALRFLKCFLIGIWSQALKTKN